MPDDHRPTSTTALLFGPIASRTIEIAACAYLDASGVVLGLRHMAGGVLSVTVPIRRIVADALAFNARHVVLAHNHPSGDPTPSACDLAFTRRLAGALDPLDMTLFDHVVLAGERRTSLRGIGFL